MSTSEHETRPVENDEQQELQPADTASGVRAGNGQADANLCDEIKRIRERFPLKPKSTARGWG